MKLNPLSLGCALLCAVTICSTNAAHAESRLSLEEVRALALKSSPLVASIDNDFASRLADSAELSELANPELEGEVGVPVDWKEQRGDTEISLRLAQPLRLSDFGSRKSLSDLLDKAAAIEQRVELFKLLKEIDLAYVQLWMVQRHRAALQSAGDSARVRAKGIAEGAARGVYSEGDRQLFAGEAARIDAESIGAEGDLRTARAKLVGLIGIPLTGELADPTHNQPVTLEQAKALERESQIGESYRSRLRAELSEKQLALAHRDALPTLTPQLIASRSDDGTTFLGAGLTVPLPVFSKNEPQIRRSEAELRAAKARARFVTSAGFEDQIATMVDAVNLAISEARAFDGKVIPAFSESLRIQERQFAAGSGSILQIWQTQRELFESRKRSLELWTKAYSLRIELELLIGEEL